MLSLISKLFLGLLALGAMLWLSRAFLNDHERPISPNPTVTHRSPSSPSHIAADASSSAAHAPRAELQAYPHLEDVEAQILQLSNAERRQHGLPPLSTEPILGLIAREHSDDMLGRRFFAHTNPDGDDAADRIAMGHRRLIGTSGENIWQGSGYPTQSTADRQTLAETILSSWMGSPGHRRNILRAEFNHLGVGVSVDGRTLLATQKFAQVLAYTQTPIPQQARRGDPLDLRTTPVGAARAPQRFDLWAKSSRRTTQNWTLESPQIPDLGGERQLRFYFPTDRPGALEIFPGPTLTIE